MRHIAGAFMLCMAIALPALADWDPADGHKMHYPQMPDPFGWDVNITRVPGVVPQRVVADDWMCSETGPVTDIHFWGSWRQDLKGLVEWIDVTIYSDVPVGQGTLPYSHPGQQLWFQSFHPGEFTERYWGSGDQGWLDPYYQQAIRPDHMGIWQYNITGINVPGAFDQVEGTIYWLAISVRLDPVSPAGVQFGWKTSIDHWNDDATWVNLPPAGAIPWEELRDPYTGQSLDMAFVITPEPVSLLLLVLGTLMLCRRRA